MKGPATAVLGKDLPTAEAKAMLVLFGYSCPVCGMLGTTLECCTCSKSASAPAQSPLQKERINEIKKFRAANPSLANTPRFWDAFNTACPRFAGIPAKEPTSTTASSKSPAEVLAWIFANQEKVQLPSHVVL